MKTLLIITIVISSLFLLQNVEAGKGKEQKMNQMNKRHDNAQKRIEKRHDHRQKKMEKRHEMKKKKIE